MKNRNFLMTIITVLALALGAVAWATPSRGQNEAEGKNSQEQEKLAKQAKITMEQARETALKRAPGNVESGELEKEHGKLVYSFDIRNSKGTITEVQVSAISGKVVRVERENKKQEAAEKDKEAKEKGAKH
jgi:uncharacterized membrane protein YkoI